MIKQIYFLLALVILPTLSSAQKLSLITQLKDSIEESSGLIYLNGKFITHNDSGGEAVLYEIDTTDGSVARTVTIDNARNVDWEDICMDSTYVYIADFGNNNGARTDLKIYRVLISDYLMTTNDTVTADTINFSYLNQSDFTPSSFSTNFDAEAIIHYRDSLYIFSKNWGNNWTYIYALPKIPGTYQTDLIDSIDVQGLITGADYNESTNKIMLSGYTYINPFMVEISDFETNKFSEGTINRFLAQTPSGSSIQIEGIVSIAANEYFLTSEVHLSGTPSFYKLESIPVSTNNIQKISGQVFPNPSTDFLQIVSDDFSQAEFYNMQGLLQKTSKNQLIPTTDLSKGIYIVVVKNSKGIPLFSKKVMIN